MANKKILTDLTVTGDITVSGGDIVSNGNTVVSNSANANTLRVGDALLASTVQTIKFRTNGADALTLNNSQNATFTGDVTANNLSGTNTGDQDLSGYALTSAIPSGNSIIDWTTDQGATNIHANNYTDTNTFRAISSTPTNGATTTSISSDWAFDNVKTAVPSGAVFTDTNTTYSTATSSTLGLVKIGFTESGKNYPVELSSGKMFVNVPWTDTDTDTNTQRTDEEIRDLAAGQWIDGTNTTVVYDDASNTIKINSVNTNTTYVSSDFTHDDLTGFVANEHIDWTVDQGATNIHSGNYTDTNTFRGIHDTPVNGATTTSISSNWAFDNVKTAVPSGALFTDTNTTYTSSDFTHDDLTGFVANEHIDWTTDQGATNIHANNYTNTNTNQLTTFQVEDGDGTEVTISHAKEWKFTEGQGINVKLDRHKYWF